MLKIRAGAIHGGTAYFPVVVAERLRFFAKNGIEVDFSEPRQGPWIAKAVLAGEADIALGGAWRPIMYRHRIGALYSFAQICDRCYLTLLSRQPLKAFQWSALEGKVVIVPAGAPSPGVFLSGLLRRAKIDEVKVSFVRDFLAVEAVDLFRAGLGDFILVTPETAIQLLWEAKASVAVHLADTGRVPWSVYYAKREFIESGDTRAARFLAALQQALSWLHASSTKDRAQLARQHYGELGDRAADAVEYCLKARIWSDSPLISEEPLQWWQEMNVEAKFMPAIMPYAEAVLSPKTAV